MEEFLSDHLVCLSCICCFLLWHSYKGLFVAICSLSDMPQHQNLVMSFDYAILWKLHTTPSRLHFEMNIVQLVCHFQGLLNSSLGLRSEKSPIVVCPLGSICPLKYFILLLILLYARLLYAH
ncbi:hypothetical protein O6H91_17G046300 [Diphasiastrum complanatum]|uniref:Uncharacterized protein n=1 Tax=Diphasiastrum complanatum TaxID=34168 RepID=A0ACC2B6I9_DIPCM|nr:hypothetical protein O6H91_17G046300 [Diphasiastrum complanatum]